jgi:hypothetical protein
MVAQQASIYKDAAYLNWFKENECNIICGDSIEGCNSRTCVLTIPNAFHLLVETLSLYLLELESL